MKRIVILYWTRAGKQSDNGWFVLAMFQVCNAVLRNAAKDPDWRTYFQLCFNFLKEAYVRYRVYQQVTKATVTLATRQGAISSGEMAAMIDDASTVGLHHAAPHCAYTTAIVDYDMAAKDVEKAKIDYIAKQSSRLAIEQSSDVLEREGSRSGTSCANNQEGTNSWRATVLRNDT